MAIITLTTDYGTKDHYAAAVKGAIYSLLPDARVVDISHNISPFNINETAYILKNAYTSFPEGSIHVVGVDAELTPNNKHVALLVNGHYFIGADNGCLSMITAEIQPEKIVEINIHDHVKYNFSVHDVFVQVACHIARGGTLEVIGKPIQELQKTTELQPVVNHEKTKILGSVIYIDNYGNAITNIHKSLFEATGAQRKFSIQAGNYTFTELADSYSSIVDYNNPSNQKHAAGSKLVLFNSSGYLEIAIYKSNPKTVGGANTLLGLDFHSTICIEFESIKSF